MRFWIEAPMGNNYRRGTFVQAENAFKALDRYLRAICGAQGRVFYKKGKDPNTVIATIRKQRYSYFVEAVKDV